MRKGQRLNTHSEPSKSRPKPFYTQNSSKNGTPTEWNNKKKQCKSFGGKLLLTLLYQLVSWAMAGRAGGEGGEGGRLPMCRRSTMRCTGDRITHAPMSMAPCNRYIYTTRALEHSSSCTSLRSPTLPNKLLKISFSLQLLRLLWSPGWQMEWLCLTLVIHVFYA